jgi:hypothetical protein
VIRVRDTNAGWFPFGVGQPGENGEGLSLVKTR